MLQATFAAVQQLWLFCKGWFSTLELLKTFKLTHAEQEDLDMRTGEQELTVKTDS